MKLAGEQLVYNLKMPVDQLGCSRVDDMDIDQLGCSRVDETGVDQL